MTKVLVLSGPNLGRLGSRQPEIYGTEDTQALVELVTSTACAMGISTEVRQSDDEAEMVRWMHEAVDTGRHVILNPAAFTHYSYALADAAKLVTEAGLLLIEVHISNTHAREGFRKTSVISPVATGVIAGFGLRSYALALHAINLKLG